MAYVGHSALDYRSLRDRAARIAPDLLIRSAFVAIAVAVAILALADAREAAAPAPAVVQATQKSDRLAASTASSGGVETGRMTVDAAARTTTVERGSVAGLSPQSPMNVAGK